MKSPTPSMLVHQNLPHLAKHELEEIQSTLEDLIHEKKQEELAKRTKTKEQIVKDFQAFGYEVKPGTKFYKIRSTGKGYGCYGMQVGEYTHSCHIDTTDLIVLLVLDESDKHDHFCESFCDLWLDGPVIV